jgi:hypothetical protein
MARHPDASRSPLSFPPKREAFATCFWCGTEYPLGGSCPRRLDARKDYHAAPEEGAIGRRKDGVNWKPLGGK